MRRIVARTSSYSNPSQVTTMKITALVSLFNSSRWLRNRIQNLLETDAYRRGELLIFMLNCQSHDVGDDAIAVQYAGVPRVHYEVYHEPCSVYAAWNYMIRRTITPYLTNANTDDVVAPDAYTKLMAACEASGSILAYPDWYVTNQENQRWPINGWLDQNGYYSPESGQLSCGHFPVWKRELHNQVGLFDPSFRALGDADLWFRAWRMGIRNFCYHGEPLGGYLWRNGQNLWHRVDDTARAAEWAKLFGRRNEKLDF
jgi:O-antigen biosynthesis protein